MPIARLRRGQTALLVIDVQERLLPTIASGEAIAHNCGVLLRVASALGMPSLVTEQYVKGLGHSAAAVAAHIGPETPVVEKTRFSGLVLPVEEFLTSRRIHTVLLSGIEAHVCVLQTALDLLGTGRLVFLATDAISSGQADQIAPAFQRIVGAGGVLSGVLGATYELLQDASSPDFRRCLELVKSLQPVARQT